MKKIKKIIGYSILVLLLIGLLAIPAIATGLWWTSFIVIGIGGTILGLIILALHLID